MELYNYTIFSSANLEVIKELCDVISKMNGVNKGSIIQDVEGSLLQEFILNEHKLYVIMDLDFDEIIIKSEENLDFTKFGLK